MLANVIETAPFIVSELIDTTMHHRRHGAPAVASIRFNVSATLSNVKEFAFLHLPALHLHDEIIVPEVAGWHKSRLAHLPDRNEDMPTPDWVLEIVYTGYENSLINAKRRIYGEAGVAFLWLLDPRTRSLEAFQLIAGKWLLVGVAEADEPVSFAPFDAISFPLSDLFPFDAPPGLAPASEG